MSPSIIWVQIGHLPGYMAAETTYNEILPSMWESFGLSSDRLRMPLPFKIDKEKLGDPSHRVAVWYYIWMRLAAITDWDEIYFQDLPTLTETPLPLYYEHRREFKMLESSQERKEMHIAKIDDLLGFLKEIEDRYGFEITLPKSLSPETKGSSKIFPCPTGTKWNDVEMVLVSHDSMRVTTPMGTEIFSYHELGLSDKRKADAHSVMWTLLMEFAKQSGTINPSDQTPLGNNLVSTKNRLDKHLKTLFGINDPICDHYRKKKAYILNFKINDQRDENAVRNIQEESFFDQEVEHQSRRVNLKIFQRHQDSDR
jgi:hypothetical protein